MPTVISIEKSVNVTKIVGVCSIIFLVSELTQTLKSLHNLNSAHRWPVFRGKEGCCTSQHSPYARTCAIGGVRWKVGEAPGRRRASCAARLGHGCARLDRLPFLIRCSDCRLKAKGAREAPRSSAFLSKDFHRSPPDRPRVGLASPRGVGSGKNDQRGRAGREKRDAGLELCGARRLSLVLGEPPKGRCCWARIFCPPAEEKMWVAAPAHPHLRCRFSRSSIDDGDDAASPSGLFLLLRILLVRDSCSPIFGL